MDPWLEHPEIWPGVHARLITSIADELAPEVAPRYFVDIEERVYFIDPEGKRFLGKPDVAISGFEEPSPSPGPASRAVTSIADFVETDVEVFEDEDEIRLRHLEIHDTASRELVTVIEVLSPTNKLHQHGREKYLDKRRAYFNADVNFVEIDLLRAGRPMPARGDGVHADYRILIARGEHLPRAKLRGFNVRQPIPPVPIPLRSGDAEPTLDLNPVLHGVYDRARYDLRIDYSTSPVPPLRTEDAEWAAGIVEMVKARS
jgi:hypothetical protein